MLIEIKNIYKKCYFYSDFKGLLLFNQSIQIQKPKPETELNKIAIGLSSCSIYNKEYKNYPFLLLFHNCQLLIMFCHTT